MPDSVMYIHVPMSGSITLVQSFHNHMFRRCLDSVCLELLDLLSKSKSGQTLFIYKIQVFL